MDRASDDAELVADLAAKEDERDNGDDGNECEDECVFSETLTVDLGPERAKSLDESLFEGHLDTSFPPADLAAPDWRLRLR
jgi:hypothetical protein